MKILFLLKGLSEPGGILPVRYRLQNVPLSLQDPCSFPPVLSCPPFQAFWEEQRLPMVVFHIAPSVAQPEQEGYVQAHSTRVHTSTWGFPEPRVQLELVRLHTSCWPPPQMLLHQDLPAEVQKP